MKTVISEDRIGRFAELDHAVVDEVRAFIETGQEEKRPDGATLLRRLGTTLLASIRLSRPS